MRKGKKSFIALLCSALLLILGSCSLPGLHTGSDKNTIMVACGSSSEYQILAGMVQGMIEHYTDKNVEIINNLGTTTVMHQAMLNDDASITSTRYTGTDLMGTLQLPPEKDPAKAFDIVSEVFEKQFQQTWLPSYGFATTYAFMVTKETAEKYNLKKVSDLKPVADELTAGVDSSWMNRDGDGYKGFTETYGVKFGKMYPMQLGLVYEALASDKMDVVLGYSTDGRIASYGLVLLEDDLHFFPPYDASIVIKDSLLKEQPELRGILEKLSGKIDTKTMQKLNYRADNDLIEPSIVAQEFLQEHHYFEDEQKED